MQEFEQQSLKQIPERHGVTKIVFQEEIIPAYKPVVLKGIFNEWPIVQAGRDSVESITEYVARYDNGNPVEIFFAPPAVKGHFFYQDNVRISTFSACKPHFATV